MIVLFVGQETTARPKVVRAFVDKAESRYFMTSLNYDLSLATEVLELHAYGIEVVGRMEWETVRPRRSFPVELAQQLVKRHKEDPNLTIVLEPSRTYLTVNALMRVLCAASDMDEGLKCGVIIYQDSTLRGTARAYFLRKVSYALTTMAEHNKSFEMYIHQSHKDVHDAFIQFMGILSRMQEKSRAPMTTKTKHIVPMLKGLMYEEISYDG